MLEHRSFAMQLKTFLLYTYLSILSFFDPSLCSDQTYMETAEVFSDVHVERLLLFSVIWSYGGVLTREVEQRKFSHLLKGLTNR